MTTQQLSFYGTDASNEISLLEYGLLVSNELHEDGSETRFCIYRVDESHFDCGHISEKEVNGYILGCEFPDEKDIASFLNWSGISAKSWLENDFATKLQDLLQYWGYENIMGSAYYPMTESEAKERYLN